MTRSMVLLPLKSISTQSGKALAVASFQPPPLPATMAWLPTLSLLMWQSALPALSTTALQPASALPPSLKLTLPVGPAPVTVAVKDTLVPALAGLLALVSTVVVGGTGGGKANAVR